MPNCVACGAELEPPVRAPHTVYVKSLYRIGGQDYCRHHIIRAAVAAGVITEVKPGPGPAVATSRGAPSTEYDRGERARSPYRVARSGVSLLWRGVCSAISRWVPPFRRRSAPA